MAKRKDKIKRFVLSKRILFTLLLVFIGITGIFMPRFFINSGSNSTLEIIYYSSQIVSAIFVLVSVILAAWQYYLASSAELQNLQISQVQRAIDLSEFYKENVLKYYNAVYYVYRSVGVIEILDKIDQDKMKNFDVTEMHKLISSTDISNLKEMQYSDKFAVAVMEADSVFNLKLHFRSRKVKLKDEEGEYLEVERISLMSSFIMGIVNNMLNDLEFFAMHFTHKTADETVVFQSLHQTYIDIVKNMYYNIANANEPIDGKYYTNIIELYHIWYKRSEELNKNGVHKTSIGTVIEKRND